MGSEYGGRPGIIQGPEGDVTEKGNAAPGHDWREDPHEAAMVMRRAGKKEAAGIPQEIQYDADGNRIAVIPYDEDRAAQDYIDGTNE